MMTAASGLNDMRGLARPLPLLSPTVMPTEFAGLLDASSLAPEVAAEGAAAVPSLLPSATATTATTGQGDMTLMPSVPGQLPGAASVPLPLPNGGAPVIAAAPAVTSAAVLATPPVALDTSSVPTAARLPSRASWSGKATPADAPGHVMLPAAAPTDVRLDSAAAGPAAGDAAALGQIDQPVLDVAALQTTQPDTPVPAALDAARAATADVSDVAIAARSPAVITAVAAAVSADHPVLRRNLAASPDDLAPTKAVEAPIAAVPLTSPLLVSDSMGADQAGGSTELMLPQASAPLSSSPVMTTQSASLAGDVPLRLIDLGADDRWIASLAQDIAALQDEDGLLRFQLLPRHLGRLEVSVQTGSEGISVRVAAESAAAQSMLAGAQARLVDDLRNNGVRIAAAEVGMQAQGWTNDRRDNDRSHPDQRWSFVETGHAADPVPLRTRGSGTDRLA